MRYRSDVRDSQVRSLRQRVEDHNYDKYLLELHLHRLRAFADQHVRFRFPVTALIGPNGGGKSTILGAAALAYKDSKPSRFFPMSSADAEAMQELRVTYTLLDRSIRRDGTIERSATHPRKKWERNALDRKLLLFPMRRTIPATERSEFTKFRTGVLALTEDEHVVLGPEVIEPAGRILGLDLSRYMRATAMRATARKPLIGYSNGVKHSEFHFGAGISVIIETLWNLENLRPEDQALILIEEVETTLHPHAVRRFVEYLVLVAERKRCQIVFTTHSEYALDPLPPAAIWAARDGQVWNGRLRVEDVLAFRGEVDTRLAVFCEDDTAKAWLEGMLRFAGAAEQLNEIEIFPVGGHSDVVKKTSAHNEDPARRFDAIGFVDGDAPPVNHARIFVLPGSFAPEEVILDGVRAGYDVNLAVLTIALQRRSEDQELVRRTIDQEYREAGDIHLIFDKVGARLGFVPRETVRGALISAYCHAQPELARQISDTVCRHLVNGNGVHGLERR